MSLACEGCGWAPGAPAEVPSPFRCERAGRDGGDHVVAPRLRVEGAVWPGGTGPDEQRPFVRFAHLMYPSSVAAELGLGDEGYRAIVDRLDSAIARVDGRSFVTTPFGAAPRLAEAVGLGGEVWVKDETGNVSGSHKGRHLFGVLLYLEVLKAAGLLPSPRPLAIASCGNAALAAAVLARAADRHLLVMVPPDAHPRVLARLRELGADVRVCGREPGTVGDPTVAAFRREVAAGALPFACQGTECGLTLDGGKTLGFEVAAAGVPLDRVFVQVGGGALASSLLRAFEDALALGALERMPRLMTVQTEAVAPLARAYAQMAHTVRAMMPGEELPVDAEDDLADRLRAPRVLEAALDVLGAMARDRAAWLPPWPSPGTSAAHGILDDETYDAIAVLRAMLVTGGSPLLVNEATVLEAEALGRETTGIDVDATGTAGLAGLLQWSRRPGVARGERTALLFTGARR